ncbi:hypothetical protein [Virgibacillus dokdonensis]|uniref:hypothetical protein n=1 Tax=Virgibacillus dokdonensis TaxID=302167 RepID=UPI00098A2DA4|nr:hypothetical protein [Virgibacillus dokdonensis]
MSNQTVTADTILKVMYPNEQYDFGNEYNPGASTFIPNCSGIYSLIASIQFDVAEGVLEDYRVRIIIRVNGVDVARDNDFFTSIDLDFDNDIAVSTIIQLNAGDIVEVFIDSSETGDIMNEPATTRFEGAKISNTIDNCPPYHQSINYCY